MLDINNLQQKNKYCVVYVNVYAHIYISINMDIHICTCEINFLKQHENCFTPSHVNFILRLGPQPFECC